MLKNLQSLEYIYVTIQSIALFLCLQKIFLFQKASLSSCIRPRRDTRTVPQPLTTRKATAGQMLIKDSLDDTQPDLKCLSNAEIGTRAPFMLDRLQQVWFTEYIDCWNDISKLLVLGPVSYGLITAKSWCIFCNRKTLTFPCSEEGSRTWSTVSLYYLPRNM